MPALIRRVFISVAARMPLVISEADAPDIFEPAPFEIDDTDTRNTVKKYRRRIFDTLRTLFYHMTQ